MAGADDTQPDNTGEVVVVRRHGWARRTAQVLAAILGGLLVLLAAVYLWLQSDSGRRFVARQVTALSFQNGMKVDVGRIDGSIFGRMRLIDVAVRDPAGVFLTAPRIDMDWRPLAYARNHVDIRTLLVPDARLYRLPRFKPTPPSDAPLLPDVDIDVNRLSVGRLRIDRPVTGRPHLVRIDGAAHIADGRAQLTARADALVAPGVAGGDRLALTLDAVPERNRFDLDLRVAAPAGGLVAGFSGVGQPMRVTLAGRGDWRAWNGRLNGTVGTQPLANVAITARDGSFAVRGPVRPGLFLTGPGRNMLEPVTRLDLTATLLAQRRVRLSGGAASDNFTFNAAGLVDLGASEMRGLRLAFRLLKPSVIAKNLNGADMAADITLNGRFAAPSVTYGLAARTLGFGATRVDGLAISGSATLDKEQWRIPVHGRARRITGINASIAPLLANVRLDGDFAYANGRLLSDNLRLLSDRIDATAVVVADMPKALYTGALNGRVNGYRVESVGIFNLDTNMDLKSGANGYFRLGGRVAARSTRLLNDSLRNMLGGNALIVADVGYDSNGVASIDRLRVSAPAFRLTGGRGRYDAAGRLSFAAQGSSDTYGPLRVDMTGTVARPLVRIVAARPGMGIGLADLSATIRGNDGAYAVAAKGGTDYGPFTANAMVTTGRGPLTVELRPGTAFSGVGLTGRIRATSAGPFAGTLFAAGSGITGRIDLGSVSGKQHVAVDATARNASLPGRVGLTTDRAIVKLDAILYDRPQIAANVQLAGTRLGDLYIAGARADIGYRGGSGQARVLVEGRTRYPFRLAANALLDPKLWRVALNGRVNGIDVATRAPLSIVPERGGYALRPGAVTVGGGTLQLAGRYGPGMEVQARLDKVNLALANPFLPNMGLGGTASGSLDFAQASANAFPRAEARLVLDDFTRTSLAAVSEPVDIQLIGRLLADGGNLRALVRRRGAAIGRMQLNLQPLGPGAGSWTTRLLAAPLSGGVRYNGPADVLFSLAALPDQSLKGPIGLAADFTGRVSAPQLTGVVRANALTYDNAQYGTRLTDMAVQGRFTNDRLQVERLTARAGDGTVSASGFVSLSAAQGFPVQLGLDMNNAQLARGSGLEARASGQIRVVNGPGQPATVSGRIDLPETHYTIVRQGSAKVTTLTGVRRKPALGRERITGAPEPAMQSLPSNWRLDVAIVAPNKIYVTGMGLNSEWSANLHVGGTSSAPEITGGVDLVRGTLGFAGRSFDLQEGRISFAGGAVTNPDMRIVASGDVADVTITITITGRAENPQIAFTSSPALPEDELMARILFGNSVGQLTAVQALQLAASLNNLRGGGGGLNPLGVLQSASGIDRLRILGADEKTGRGTSVAVGQYITNNVYVEFVTDARGYTATQLEISLSRALSVLSQTGSFGSSSVNLRYRRKY